MHLDGIPSDPGRWRETLEYEDARRAILHQVRAGRAGFQEAVDPDGMRRLHTLECDAHDANVVFHVVRDCNRDCAAVLPVLEGYVRGDRGTMILRDADDEPLWHAPAARFTGIVLHDMLEQLPIHLQIAAINVAFADRLQYLRLLIERTDPLRETDLAASIEALEEAYAEVMQRTEAGVES